jgi:hypothetical protein
MTDIIITGAEVMRLTGVYPLSEKAFKELINDPRVREWLDARQPRDERGKPAINGEGGT